DVEWRWRRIETPRASPVRQEGPDLFSYIRKLRTAERGTPIGAAPDPVDGPRKDQIRIRRVHKNGMGLELAKNVLPGTSCARAAEDADLTLRVRTPHIAGDSGINISLSSHRRASLLQVDRPAMAQMRPLPVPAITAIYGRSLRWASLTRCAREPPLTRRRANASRASSAFHRSGAGLPAWQGYGD